MWISLNENQNQGSPEFFQRKNQKIDKDDYEIWLKEKPVDNKANNSLIKLLKNHFEKDVRIISGFKSRRKIVEAGD